MSGEVMWELAQRSLLAVLGLVVPVAVAAVATVGRQWLLAKVGETRLAQAQEIVRAAVLAAEQNGLASEIRATGGAKKEYAIRQVQAWLDQAGIQLDFRAIDALIESTVLEEFNRGRALAGHAPAPAA